MSLKISLVYGTFFSHTSQLIDLGVPQDSIPLVDSRIPLRVVRPRRIHRVSDDFGQNALVRLARVLLRVLCHRPQHVFLSDALLDRTKLVRSSGLFSQSLGYSIRSPGSVSHSAWITISTLIMYSLGKDIALRLRTPSECHANARAKCE